MTQRKRKPSKLTVSPLAPPVDDQMNQGSPEVAEEATAPQETAMAPAAPAASAAPREATKAAPKAPKKKKVSFYLAPEEEARAEAARLFTMGHTGLTTVTSYYEQAIAEFTRKLEAEYNDSKPFEKPSE